LARSSGGNLRRALLSLEALHTQDQSFKAVEASLPAAKDRDPDTIPKPDWEKYCSKVVEKILGEQSPERLLEVRGMLYELLVHCIPAPLIVKVCLRLKLVLQL
jgi:replication factor C subunit 3/5